MVEPLVSWSKLVPSGHFLAGVFGGHSGRRIERTVNSFLSASVFYIPLSRIIPWLNAQNYGSLNPRSSMS